MSGQSAVVLGDKGRIVVPAAVRERRHWVQGTPLILVETTGGVLLTERTTALRMLREQLGSRSLAAELIDERRSEAAADLPHR